MFSFIRWIYRRIYITILLFKQIISELIESVEPDGKFQFAISMFVYDVNLRSGHSCGFELFLHYLELEVFDKGRSYIFFCLYSYLMHFINFCVGLDDVACNHKLPSIYMCSHFNQ